MNNWIGLTVFSLAMLVSCIWSYNTIGSIFPSDWRVPTTITQIQISVFAVLIKIAIDIISQFRIVIYKSQCERLQVRHIDNHVLILTIVNKGGVNANIHEIGFGNSKGLYIKYFPQYPSHFKELDSYYIMPELPLTIPRGESKQIKFTLENNWPIESWKDCDQIILTNSDGNKVHIKRRAIDEWFTINRRMLQSREQALIDSFANTIDTNLDGSFDDKNI